MTASMYNVWYTIYIKCILTLNEQLPYHTNNEHTPNTSISHSRIHKYFFAKTIVYHHYIRCHYLIPTYDLSIGYKFDFMNSNEEKFIENHNLMFTDFPLKRLHYPTHTATVARKICVRTPKSCSQRSWSFDTIHGELKVPSKQHFKAISRSGCMDKCLNEKSFQCRQV